MEHVLAADVMKEAISVFRSNFGVNKGAKIGDVAKMVPGWPGEPLVPHSLCDADLLLAGPPCQGHSDLNNHSRRNDPRNSLYLKVVRYAELVRPKVVLIENVPTVALAKEMVVEQAEEAFDRLGYHTCRFTVNALDIGLAQRRKRLVLVASHVPMTKTELLLCDAPKQATLEQYIGDLNGEAETSDELFRTPSRMLSDNQRRAKWLLANDAYDLPDEYRPPCHRDKAHSYKSMYGRLRWNQPAQTITTGFGSMGQGRFMHPSNPRVITPHEAARIQGFPDFFDFSSVTTRTKLHKLIGNAVPPIISACIVNNLTRLGALT